MPAAHRVARADKAVSTADGRVARAPAETEAPMSDLTLTIIAATLALACLGVWLMPHRSGALPGTAIPMTVSIDELQARTDVRSLPVQVIDSSI
jgi:hypothetical protein